MSSATRSHDFRHHQRQVDEGIDEGQAAVRLACAWWQAPPWWPATVAISRREAWQSAASGALPPAPAHCSRPAAYQRSEKPSQIATIGPGIEGIDDQHDDRQIEHEEADHRDGGEAGLALDGEGRLAMAAARSSPPCAHRRAARPSRCIMQRDRQRRTQRPVAALAELQFDEIADHHVLAAAQHARRDIGAERGNEDQDRTGNDAGLAPAAMMIRHSTCKRLA